MLFENVTKVEIPEGEVSALAIDGVEVWSAVKPIDYLCFTAVEANSTVRRAAYGSNVPAVSLEYSTDKVTWSELGATTITLTNIGDSVFLRGDNSKFAVNDYKYNYFAMTGKIAASGDLMTIFDKTGESTTITSEYACACMFYNCASLVSAPDIRATTLSNYCFSSMFYGCTALTTAPELPATTLANSCYNYMFRGCTSLTAAPALPATTLASSCYSSMFYGCTALTTAPELPAVTMKANCYMSMFWNCTSLEIAPELPASTLSGNCYANMFYGCSSLNEVRVAFTAFGESPSWLTNVAAEGTFYCPATLDTSTRDASHVPEGWTVVNV